MSHLMQCARLVHNWTGPNVGPVDGDLLLTPSTGGEGLVHLMVPQGPNETRFGTGFGPLPSDTIEVATELNSASDDRIQ